MMAHSVAVWTKLFQSSRCIEKPIMEVLLQEITPTSAYRSELAYTCIGFANGTGINI